MESGEDLRIQSKGELYIQNHGQLTKINVINTHFLKQTLQDNLGVLLRFTVSTAAAAYLPSVRRGKAHGRYDVLTLLQKENIFPLTAPLFQGVLNALAVFVHLGAVNVSVPSL